jgi:hypothetical protein
MNATTTHLGLTARVFFLGDGTGDEVTVLQNAISQHGILSQVGGELTRLTPEARRAADLTLASVTAGLLEIDLGDVLIFCWRTHDRLVNAAKETIRVPGRQEVVQLGSHQVTWMQNPTVDILVDGARVHTFRFRLTLVFQIEVAAVVQQGKLTALQAGDSSVAGTFSVEIPGGDIELLRHERKIDLHAIVQLGSGIQLLRREPSPTAGTGPTAAADVTT